jgi:hypothetical protein
MWPSSREITVSMRHWYLSLSMDATHAEWQTPVSHRYSNFSWWWGYGCPKHVEKRNKYTKQNCAPSWIYLQDCTRMYGEQNLKFKNMFLWHWAPYVQAAHPIYFVKHRLHVEFCCLLVCSCSFIFLSMKIPFHCPPSVISFYLCLLQLTLNSGVVFKFNFFLRTTFLLPTKFHF